MQEIMLNQLSHMGQRNLIFIDIWLYDSLYDAYVALLIKKFSSESNTVPHYKYFK